VEKAGSEKTYRGSFPVARADAAATKVDAVLIAGAAVARAAASILLADLAVARIGVAGLASGH
jgi:hypothetical protein